MDCCSKRFCLGGWCKVKVYCLVVAVLSGTGLCWGNGGGYIQGGKYSSLMPFEMGDIDKIAMETENLRVEVGPKNSLIHVHYRMRNTTASKVNCRFGFPVR